MTQSAADWADFPWLLASPRLTDVYDVALLDLDGVVYVGSQAVTGIPDVLTAARATGMRLAYVTNNASRRPSEVAALLISMGIPAETQDVITSGQAAVHMLRDRLARGDTVLIVGTSALSDEVRDAGLVPVSTADPLPAAVLQGYGPGVGYAELAEAAVAIRGGALWVATNTDSTIPSARGPLPGNGALVAALRVATGVQPAVVGKPHPGLHQECLERTQPRTPLVVGDRLDSDIEGAVAVGADSLLVLTGVTTPSDLLAAPSHSRPTYVAYDLSGLLQAHPAARWDGSHARCEDFTAGWDGLDLVLSGDGPSLPALRALCAARWAADRPQRQVRAVGPAAAAALHQLCLGG